MSLVVVDADVLGRRRTGDETYVRNLLRTLPGPAADAGLEIAAVTRHPELVPDGVLPVLLPARSQELRMAWTLPRTLRRLGAALVHTQYALPFRCPVPRRRDHPRPLLRARPDGAPRSPRLRARGAARRARSRTRPDRLRAHETRPRGALRHPAGTDRRHPERRRPGIPPRDAGRAGGAALRPRRGGDPGAEEPACSACRGARGRARARRRRPREGRARCGRAPRGRRTPRGIRRGRAARRALPRRRVPRPVVPLRGLRPAGRRGDGIRDAGRDGARPGAGRGRRRRGRRRPRGRARRRDPPRARGAGHLAAAGLERARAFTWEAAARATVTAYVEALGR